MVQQLPKDTTTHIIYPDSDGRPMADSTRQFRSRTHSGNQSSNE